MKAMILGAVLIFTLVPSSVNCTATTTSPANNPSNTSTFDFAPPSVKELSDGGFSHPEIPRITSEQLMMMKDEGKVSPDDFVLVEIEVSSPSNIADEESSATEYIWGTTKFISVPTSSAPSKLSDDILFVLRSLPKDKLIIFYDGGDKDTLSATFAQLLIDLGDGHDSTNVKVLWMGLGWWKELGYPYYPNSNPGGL